MVNQENTNSLGLYRLGSACAIGDQRCVAHQAGVKIVSHVKCEDRLPASKCEDCFQDCLCQIGHMNTEPVSSGDNAATVMATTGSSTTSTVDAVATTPFGTSAGSGVMTAFLESVRAMVRGEICRHIPEPSANESNHPPASLAGPSGDNPEAEAPLPPATATAGP